MASLLRLKLQGVRSFRDDNPHYMSFLHPLTVISGPNGSGKTTIIEALNYITTGKLPTGQMNVFVNNPEINVKKQTDGLVQLEFKDCQDNICTATKRFTGSKKGVKVTTKSDEFTLKVRTPEGKETSISSKVADFKSVLNTHLGIPQAILDQVVFCHQEDSCWPLCESGELKTRFDSIFQLTTFVKAMAEMKKVKKEFENELSILEAQKAGLMFKIEQKYQLVHEEEEYSLKEAAESEKIDELNEIIAEKKAIVAEFTSQLKMKDSIENEIAIKDAQRNGLRAQLEVLRVEPYLGTSEELENEISEMKNSIDYRSIEQEKKNIEINLVKAADQVEKFNRERSKKMEEISQLKANEMQRSEILSEIENARNFLDMETPFGDDGDIIESFKSLFSLKEQERTSHLETSKKISLKYQGDVDKAQKELTTLDVNIGNCGERERQIKEEIRQLEMKQRRSSGSSERLQRLTKEKKDLEKTLENLPEFEENLITELIKERSEAQKELVELNARSSKAEEFADAEKELVRKEEEVEETREKLHELLSKHEQSWKVVYGPSRPDGPWSTSVREVYAEISESLKNTQSKCRDEQMKEQHLSTLTQQKRREIEKLEGDVEMLKDSIWQKTSCDPTDVTARLADVQKQLKMARKDLAPIDAKESLYQSWIEKTREKGCCPLCDRKFQTETAKRSFRERLEDESMHVPDEKEALEKCVLEKEELVRSLMSAKMEAEQLEKLMIEQEEAKQMTKEVEQQLEIVRECLKHIGTDQEELSTNFAVVQELQAEVGYMDQLQEKLKVLEIDIKKLKKSLTTREEEIPASTLRRMCSEKQEKIAKLVSKCENLQMAANQRNSLCDRMNAVREEIVTLGENAAKISSILEQLADKKKILENLGEELEEYEISRPGISKKLQELIHAKKQNDECERQKEMEILKELQELEHKLNRIRSLMDRLDQLPSTEAGLTTLNSELKEIEKEVAYWQKRRMALELDKTNLGDSQVKLRTLEDQFTSMLIEKQANQVEEEIKELKKKTGINFRELRKQYATALAEVNTGEMEVARRSGGLNEIRNKLYNTREKLKVFNNEKVEEAYRTLVSDIVITRTSCEDCVRHITCIDESLMQFHKEKLGEVNDVLEDLWQMAHRGGNIDSIWIKSNEVKDAAKSYEYSLMMSVNGVETEMRGKCSAGQKMLASLIIRIALADVFGGLCQIITLDEPTTNLDVQTISHFTSMLIDLIDYRSKAGKERNFQLVVISHDINFVNSLTQSCRPNYIYELERSDSGTTIKKRYPNGVVETSRP